MKETSLALVLSLWAPLHLPVWKAQRLPQPFNVQQICSKSIHHPSSALRHSSIAFVSYSIILSILRSFLLFPLFSSKIKNSTPLCVLGKKKEANVISNNAPFRIKSEFPGFRFWSSDFVYSHIAWKYNSPTQSGLFSFASRCCLDAICLWWNLRTPPSTFAFECTRFIGVVGHRGETPEVNTMSQITASFTEFRPSVLATILLKETVWQDWPHVTRQLMIFPKWLTGDLEISEQST